MSIAQPHPAGGPFKAPEDERPAAPGHDGPLAREGILVIALVGVLAVTGVAALLASGPVWLPAAGISLSVISVFALLRMFEWLVGPSEHDEHHT